MYTLLLSGLLAVFVVQDRPPAQPGQPGQPGATGQPRPTGADKPGMAASLDGNWTVVAAEMNGMPVPEAMKMTVTVRDNVVTFVGGGGATGAEPGKMKAVRLSFGPSSTIRVTEAGADGKFATGAEKTPSAPPPAGGKDEKKDPATTPPAGTTQPGGTTGTQPGGTVPHGTKTGVYVLTQDYLALSIHEDMGATGTTPGIRPGGQPGTGTTPPAGGQPGTATPPPAGTTPPGAGTPPAGTTQPGTATPPGTGTQPGATPGTQPGTVGGDAMRPTSRSYMTVILKRAGGDTPRPGETPKRDKE